MFTGSFIRYENTNGVNNVFISQNDREVGRIRFTFRNNKPRYTYNDLKTGKLYFVSDIEAFCRSLTVST